MVLGKQLISITAWLMNNWQTAYPSITAIPESNDADKKIILCPKKGIDNIHIQQ